MAIAAPGVWPTLKPPRLSTLLEHWAARRQGLRMPRSAIEPAAIKSCLPNIWLYRFLPEDNDFVCTVSGEQVNEAWGTSLMGKRLGAIMPESMLPFTLLIYRRILEMPAIQTSRRRIAPPNGVEQSSERLIVPLSDDEGRPYGILGVTSYALGGLAQLMNRSEEVEDAAVLYPCAGLPQSPPR